MPDRLSLPFASLPEFEPAVPGDAEAIAALSHTIWLETYLPHVLSRQEFDFFWHRSYEPASLLAQMRSGYLFEWIRAGKTRVGFMAYRIEPDRDRLHLSKLYLLPECHGRGIGHAALRRVQSYARARGLGEIYLYVFRGNTRAIRAYRRAGFVISRAEMTDCGNGFCYDDYVMVSRDHVKGSWSGPPEGPSHPEA